MAELNNKIPNYGEIIQEILDGVNGPIQVEELAARLLEKRPSKAKNPYRAALNKIREENGRKLIYTDKDHILPIRLAFQGVRFRIQLTKVEVNRRSLSFDEYFREYLPNGMRAEKILFVDSKGELIPHTTANKLRKSNDAFFGDISTYVDVVVLKKWFDANRIEPKDHVLITIMDWKNGIIQLEHERFGKHNPKLLAEQNRFLADQIFAMLEAAQNEDIQASIFLPTLYAKIKDKHGFIPDHFNLVIHEDKRMVCYDSWVSYSDSGYSMLDRMFAEVSEQSLIAPAEIFTEEEGRQIYRFRAYFKHKPSIWREIEIEGSQTLADMDHQLRISFQHDSFEHLSGFWKMIVRGSSARKKYREVEIGKVNPFENSGESDTAIVALKLQTNDRLKYVYDFGDWIEHTLELKAIHEPVKGSELPREIARNKPEYEYCVECEQKGKQTIAKWICLSCSNEQQRDIKLCSACLGKHEDCYVEEIVY